MAVPEAIAQEKKYADYAVNKSYLWHSDSKIFKKKNAGGGEYPLQCEQYQFWQKL